MVNYDGEDKLGNSCWHKDYEDALRVSAFLGVPLLKLDFKEDYEREVLNRVFEDYSKGLTPNPDVLCNQYVKFGSWLKKAEELGYDFIATGHYAGVEEKNGEFFLKEALDKNKDQTYFLHELNQLQLSKVIFPLDNLTKSDVREIAKEINLPNAEKAESMGICFIGEVDMKEFLRQKLPVKIGEIINIENGEKIGEHDGIWFYTVGQRHGFSQSGGSEVMYIVKKDLENNLLFVGGEEELKNQNQNLILKNIHFINRVILPFECLARVRHRGDLKKVKIEENGKVEFLDEIPVLSSGQYIVFYKDGICLGGAQI
jgi:tRNA-specific 2-thiouridylase